MNICESDVAVIIPTHNERVLLESCLNSIREKTTGVNVVVCVVDNASSDGTADMLRQRFPGVQVITSGENLYFTPANNVGARRTTSRYILLLNPDTELLNNAIFEMFSFMEAHPEAGACSCALLRPDGSVQPTSYSDPNSGLLVAHLLGLSAWASWLKKWKLAVKLARLLGNNVSSYLQDTAPNKVMEVQVVSGACLFFRRNLIYEIGEMDENFKLGPDDWDWCIRIRRAGWKIFLLPKPKVVHVVGSSLTGAAGPAALESYRGWFYFYRKYYGLLRNLVLVSIVSPLLILRLIRVLLREVTKMGLSGSIESVTRQIRFHVLLVFYLFRDAVLGPKGFVHWMSVSND